MKLEQNDRLAQILIDVVCIFQAAKLNELLSAVDHTCDSKRRTLSVLARIALVEVMAENGLPFGDVMKQLVSDVSISICRSELDIPRLFVDSIEDIMKCNDSLELGQHLIVGEFHHFSRDTQGRESTTTDVFETEYLRLCLVESMSQYTVVS